MLSQPIMEWGSRTRFGSERLSWLDRLTARDKVLRIYLDFNAEKI